MAPVSCTWLLVPLLLAQAGAAHLRKITAAYYGVDLPLGMTGNADMSEIREVLPRVLSDLASEKKALAGWYSRVKAQCGAVDEAARQAATKAATHLVRATHRLEEKNATFLAAKQAVSALQLQRTNAKKESDAWQSQLETLGVIDQADEDHALTTLHQVQKTIQHESLALSAARRKSHAPPNRLRKDVRFLQKLGRQLGGAAAEADEGYRAVRSTSVAVASVSPSFMQKRSKQKLLTQGRQDQDLQQVAEVLQVDENEVESGQELAHHLYTSEKVTVENMIASLQSELTAIDVQMKTIQARLDDATVGLEDAKFLVLLYQSEEMGQTAFRRALKDHCSNMISCAGKGTNAIANTTTNVNVADSSLTLRGGGALLSTDIGLLDPTQVALIQVGQKRHANRASAAAADQAELKDDVQAQKPGDMTQVTEMIQGLIDSLKAEILKDVNLDDHCSDGLSNAKNAITNLTIAEDRAKAAHDLTSKAVLELQQAVAEFKGSAGDRNKLQSDLEVLRQELIAEFTPPSRVRVDLVKLHSALDLACNGVGNDACVWNATDLEGDNLEGMPLEDVPSSVACRALCDARQDCVVWKFVRVLEKCWLRSAHAASTTSDTAVSGTRNCPGDTGTSPNCLAMQAVGSALAGWTSRQGLVDPCTITADDLKSTIEQKKVAFGGVLSAETKRNGKNLSMLRYQQEVNDKTKQLNFARQVHKDLEAQCAVKETRKDRLAENEATLNALKGAYKELDGS